jgi:hypothetical protein
MSPPGPRAPRPTRAAQARPKQSRLVPKRAATRRQRIVLGLSALVLVVAAGVVAFALVQGKGQAQRISFVGVHPYTGKAPPVATSGQPIDGILCLGSEQLAMHIHQHIDVVINGKIEDPPPYIGFAAGGKCLYWIHVHADYPGVIHVESPNNATYSLGDYLDIWAATPTNLAKGIQVSHAVLKVIESRNPDRVIVDGKAYGGDVRAIPLKPHTLITLEYGKPYVAQQPFDFSVVDGTSMPQQH